jgi:type I restriction enzyme S subunit
MSIAANIGYTAILDFDCYFPDSVVGIIPDNNHILSTYLHYCLRFYQSRLEKEAKSTAQKNINLGILNPLEIPVPPMQLQKKFTEIVEKTERLKEMQKQSRNKIEDLLNAVMKKAFRDDLKC